MFPKGMTALEGNYRIEGDESFASENYHELCGFWAISDSFNREKYRSYEYSFFKIAPRFAR